VRQALSVVERDLFGDLDAAELATLRGLLDRVRTRLDDPACTEA
jgi:hypothetical protein